MIDELRIDIPRIEVEIDLEPMIKDLDFSEIETREFVNEEE